MLDPSGAVVPSVTVHLKAQNGVEVRSGTSDDSGRFGFLLLVPGTYELRVERANFATLDFPDLQVLVTETLHLEFHLHLSTRIERTGVSVYASPMVQTGTSALGQTVNERAVGSLPLVTRNVAQITGLSPGVIVGVYNAGELGLGGTALSQIAKSNDGVFVHGMRSYDNNWQLDGISVSDVQGSGASSGGIPIPNPDAIQEFKVQTGIYAAAFGRYGGANVSLNTKMGGDAFHGTAFEFFRNTALNANDFFRNLAAQQRSERSSIDLRPEFFNALNHPQFANPDTNYSSPTFGVISSTSVNPRVGQLAVRLSF